MIHPSRPFKILGIDHLGIVPRDVNTSLHFFCDLLGLKNLRQEVVSDQKVSADVVNAAHTENGFTKLEFLQPTDPTSPIQGFLTKRGGGIHHIALRVDDIEAALNYLKDHGVRLIDEQARNGVHGSRIAFVHPESTAGVLVELVQK